MKSQAEKEEEQVLTQPVKRKKLTLDDRTGTSSKQELETIDTDVDGGAGAAGAEVVVAPALTPQERIPQSSSPSSRKKGKMFVCLQENCVGLQRDEEGRVTYPSEICHGVTMDFGQGCIMGVEVNDVTARVMDKLKKGMLAQHYFKYTFGKQKGASLPVPVQAGDDDGVPPVDSISSKVEETSSCIGVSSASSLLNWKSLDGTAISVEGISSAPVSTSALAAASTTGTFMGGWGNNMFTMKSGGWKCEMCYSQNEKEATKCVACGDPSAVLGGEDGDSAAATASIPKFSVGKPALDADKKKDKRFYTGGFTFAAPKADDDHPTPPVYSPAFTFGAAGQKADKKEEDKPAAPGIGGFCYDDEKENKPAPTDGGFTFRAGG